MNKENNFSAEDLFAEQFSEYYAQTHDIYGDDMDAAYEEFLAFSQGEVTDETYSEDEETEEDAFANAFADFYEETQDIYGDNYEEAYEDFMELSQEDEEEDVEDETTEDEEMSDEEFDAFSEFYEASGDTYDDSDEGLEQAYADFLASAEATEDTYSEEDLSEEELAFVDFYSATSDLYNGNFEEAYADFQEFTNEGQVTEEVENEDTYGVMDFLKRAKNKVKENVGENGKFDKWLDKKGTQLKNAGLASPYGGQKAFSDESEVEGDQFSTEAEANTFDLEAFSEGFANFYADAEETYGDDDEGVEEAYDDYSDMIAEQELEAMYSAFNVDGATDSEYSAMAKSAGVGAVGGMAAGLIGTSMGAAAKERRALKAKKKSGVLTASEADRYAQLKGNRRKIIAASTVGGAGAGVGAATATTKGKEVVGKGKEMADKLKAKMSKDTANSAEDVEGVTAEVAETVTSEATDTNNSAEDRLETKEVAEVTETVVAEKVFSAVDLIGRAGLSTMNLGSTKTKKESKDLNFSLSDETKSALPGSFVLDILKK